MTKKCKLPKPVTPKNELEIVSKNGIRNNSKAEVSKARETLLSGKELELEQKKKGYRWMYKGKSSKLVNPNRIEFNLLDGWILQESVGD